MTERQQRVTPAREREKEQRRMVRAMTPVASWRKYEKHIEQLLRNAVSPDATVEFDVMLPGHISGIDRQVDVLVTGTFAGLAQVRGRLVVDCKHYTMNVDGNGVGMFVSLVEDVGADHGLMVTTKGYSPAARTMADNTRGINVDVVAAPVDVVTVRELEEGFRIYHPSSDERYYTSGAYDSEPYGPSGTNVQVCGPNDFEVLAADLDWGDETGRRGVARLILANYLEVEPEESTVELFLAEMGWKFTDGDDWVIWFGELSWLP